MLRAPVRANRCFASSRAVGEEDSTGREVPGLTPTVFVTAAAPFAVGAFRRCPAPSCHQLPHRLAVVLRLHPHSALVVQHTLVSGSCRSMRPRPLRRNKEVVRLPLLGPALASVAGASIREGMRCPVVRRCCRDCLRLLLDGGASFGVSGCGCIEWAVAGKWRWMACVGPFECGRWHAAHSSSAHSTDGRRLDPWRRSQLGLLALFQSVGLPCMGHRLVGWRRSAAPCEHSRRSVDVV